MEYLIPLLVAYGVYLYNYRKIIKIKSQLVDLKYKVMDNDDKWITEKFEKVFEKIAHLDSRLSKLEARLGVYVGLAVFVSQAVIKLVFK